MEGGLDRGVIGDGGTVAGSEAVCLELYMRDTRHRLLSGEEEKELAERIVAGRRAAERVADGGMPSREAARLRRLVRKGREAERTLASHNWRLVIDVAKKARSRYVPLLDLVQEGNVALLRAAETYDGRGRFSTYAWRCVWNAVLRALDEERRERSGGACCAEALSLEHGRDDGDHCLGEELGAPPGDAWLAADRRVAVLPGLRERLLALLVEADLSDAERRAVVVTFGLDGGEPESYAALGRREGVSREAIRQRLARGLDKIRACGAEERLRPFRLMLECR